MRVGACVLSVATDKYHPILLPLWARLRLLYPYSSVFTARARGNRAEGTPHPLD